MGFFTKDSTPSPDGTDGLAPLSKDRIKHGLEAQGWSYSVDSDGDIGGGWEYASFYFMLNGKEDELLCIRGNWRGQLVSDEFANIAMICNNWNAERLWPKVYARTDDEGIVRVHTEHNVDFEQGITDGQLGQQLQCAISTSMAFFEQVNEAYPEVWAKYKPEDD